MSSSSPKPDKNQPASGHDHGALAAWSMIGGGLVGALIGAPFHRAWVGSLTLGVVSWLAGALIDRARR